MFIIVKCEIYKLEMEIVNKDSTSLLKVYIESFVKDAIDRSVETAERRNSPIVTEKHLEENIADILLNYA
ncbi:hypothetical protein O9G_001326 [Rozella allomycis CSF55]|uniref:Centromere protein X n=1 Tax=Rozella allomycis (strain CSF55) TaxID=988480 RepID=A0A075AV38_ROZAC|nr:hypothetical protein O9G_001326 [Rozella allomycis CSF55]|eukprot:EPZ32424.1 hypothetical protein O9G_001326 [Rozella allomycis CSF55]